MRHIKGRAREILVCHKNGTSWMLVKTAHLTKEIWNGADGS